MSENVLLGFCVIICQWFGREAVGYCCEQSSSVCHFQLNVKTETPNTKTNLISSATVPNYELVSVSIKQNKKQNIFSISGLILTCRMAGKV